MCNNFFPVQIKTYGGILLKSFAKLCSGGSPRFQQRHLTWRILFFFSHHHSYAVAVEPRFKPFPLISCDGSFLFPNTLEGMFFSCPFLQGVSSPGQMLSQDQCLHISGLLLQQQRDPFLRSNPLVKPFLHLPLPLPFLVFKVCTKNF